MKKYLLSAFVVVTFLGYALFQHRFIDTATSSTINSPTTSTTSTDSSNQGQGNGNGNGNGFGGNGQMMGSGGMHGMMGGYKDGQYTGQVVDAFYGYVQVKATISGGKITDVQFLQHPSDRRTSEQINSYAMPYLKQEAIQAQSASVNGVSGATATSRAFIESLQSALDQAQT